MIKNSIRIKSGKLFSLTALATIIALFLSTNAPAQVFPLPYGFPAYPYFSPIIPFAPVNPIPSAPVFSLAPSLPPPTASIQGITIYIPVAATSFNLGVGIPGLALGPLVNPLLKLTSLSAPTTVFIYPSGYVPPAPAVPTAVAPTVIPPPIVAPTLVAPTVVAPTVVSPTVVPPATTSIPAAVSGTFLLFNTLSFPALGPSFSYSFGYPFLFY